MNSELAIVTGAAGTIGRAVARRFLAADFSVLMVDADERRLGRVADDLASASGPRKDLRTLVTDITSESCQDELRAYAKRRPLKRLVLVNNAAVLNSREPSLELAGHEWTRVLDTNLRAAIDLSAAVIDGLKAADQGVIVNVSSVASSLCRVGEGPYSVAKAGLEALTRNLALELGPLGVRCNAVAPGLIESPFLTRYADRYEPEIRATALRRFGRPDEVASVIYFLASDDAAFITGTTINVSGGWVL